MAMSEQQAPHPVQVVLVSAQPTPNLTPALDPRTRPQELVMVVSSDMVERAEWLQQTLQPRGIKASLWPVEDAWDIAYLRERIFALVAERDGEGLVLNATGGTKPMSIAAYEVFRDMDLPVFYVHPGKDRLVWMHPWQRQGFDLADRVKLPAFFQAHGVQLDKGIERAGIPAPMRALGAQLIREVDALERPLATLNWLASAARNADLSVVLDGRNQRDRPLQGLLQRFADAGVLRMDGTKLRFANDDARFFANGGWLEEYVFGVLVGLRKDLPQIQDLARSVEVCRGERNNAVRNELDVAFLADNRLYVIECKTKRFRGGGPQSPGAEALYKLDTLAPLLGGTGARAMLASFQELPKADIHRARELNILTCVGPALHQLGERVRRWLA